MGNKFKFGSGEGLDAPTKIRPRACPKCGHKRDVIIVTGSFGLRQWMCRECKAKYDVYMMKYHLKAWSILETDVHPRQKRMYAFRVHDTNAAVVAAGGIAGK